MYNMDPKTHWRPWDHAFYLGGEGGRAPDFGSIFEGFFTYQNRLTPPELMIPLLWHVEKPVPLLRK